MKKKTKKVFTVTVPKYIFPGFYNTDYDPANILYNEEEDEEEEVNDADYIDKAEDYMNTVVNNIVDHYKSVLPSQFKILSYELSSPKEYNYRNDEIILQIECTYEDILYCFFNYDPENLIDYLELDRYHDDYYPEALLEVLLEFWPFNSDDEEFDDITIKDKFIYGW